MNIRFQADADLDQTIVAAVLRREPGIDFQTASVAGLAGRSDREVRSIAAREGRLLGSHDGRTMPRHCAMFIMAQTRPGLLFIPQHLSVDLAVEPLLLIWAASDCEEWMNRIAYLPL